MAIATALVSYHNTLPFLFAFQQSEWSDHFELQIVPPSKCAQLYKNEQVDLALVPVGALSELSDYTIISDTCIGALAEVYTVAIFSNKPIHECTHLVLDADSRTSNELAQVLLKNYLNLHPEIKGNVTYPIQPEEYTAYVLIGDKVFEYEHQFAYKYDMSKLWNQFTGLPFAFAVWIIRNTVDLESRKMAEKVINSYSLDNIKNTMIGSNMSLHDYLTKFISFSFDQDKRTALNHFLKLQKILHESHLLEENLSG